MHMEHASLPRGPLQPLEEVGAGTTARRVHLRSGHHCILNVPWGSESLVALCGDACAQTPAIWDHLHTSAQRLQNASYGSEGLATLCEDAVICACCTGQLAV